MMLMVMCPKSFRKSPGSISCIHPKKINPNPPTKSYKIHDIPRLDDFISPPPPGAQYCPAALWETDGFHSETKVPPKICPIQCRTDGFHSEPRVLLQRCCKPVMEDTGNLMVVFSDLHALTHLILHCTSKRLQDCDC